MSDQTRDALAEVLAVHEDYGLYSEAGGDTHYVCACDEVKRPGTHRAHLADALAAHVRAERAGALREAALSFEKPHPFARPLTKGEVASILRRAADDYEADRGDER